MGKQTNKNIFAVVGVICAVLGVMGGIPSFLQKMLGFAITSSFLVIIGLIFLAIAFGD